MNSPVTGLMFCADTVNNICVYAVEWVASVGNNSIERTIAVTSQSVSLTNQLSVILSKGQRNRDFGKGGAVMACGFVEPVVQSIVRVIWDMYTGLRQKQDMSRLNWMVKLQVEPVITPPSQRCHMQELDFIGSVVSLKRRVPGAKEMKRSLNGPLMQGTINALKLYSAPPHLAVRVLVCSHAS